MLVATVLLRYAASERCNFKRLCENDRKSVCVSVCVLQAKSGPPMRSLVPILKFDRRSLKLIVALIPEPYPRPCVVQLGPGEDTVTFKERRRTNDVTRGQERNVPAY